MKNWIIITLCICLAVSVTACSQRGDTKEPVSSQSQSISENLSTPSEQERHNGVSDSSATGEKSDNSTADIHGMVTSFGDKRCLFPDTTVIAGTSQDKLDMGELVASMSEEVAYIYVTSMDCSSERDLTQEEISSIISLLQNSPTSIYESLGNPPTGGIYFTLVAHDKNDKVYLRISFNGEWVVYQLQSDDRVFAFNGENSGLEAIRDIIITE